MQVRLLTNLKMDGQHYASGAVLDLEDDQAHELCGCGSARALEMEVEEGRSADELAEVLAEKDSLIAALSAENAGLRKQVKAAIESKHAPSETKAKARKRGQADEPAGE